jgi:hypothetical protein
MKYYISLPISNKDESVQRKLANSVVTKIHKLGHQPINPFTIGDILYKHYKNCHKQKPNWKEYMQADIAELIYCHAIVLCEGWNESKGCKLEWEIAKGLGLRIIDEKEL